MFTLDEIKNFDIFFFHGEVDPNLEIQSEITQGILQPLRTMFYNRSDGSSVHERENFPNAVALQVGVKYDIASYIAFRNQNVSDGTNGKVDKRVAVSQTTINVENEENGLAVRILYIPLKDTQKPQVINLPL